MKGVRMSKSVDRVIVRTAVSRQAYVSASVSATLYTFPSTTPALGVELHATAFTHERQSICCSLLLPSTSHSHCAVLLAGLNVSYAISLFFPIVKYNSTLTVD